MNQKTMAKHSRSGNFLDMLQKKLAMAMTGQLKQKKKSFREIYNI